MKNEDKHLPALIALLDDQDKEVVDHVFKKLVSYGVEVIPSLEDAWIGITDQTVHERLEDVIHKIQYEDLKKDVAAWARPEEPNMNMGAYLIAKFQYAELDLYDIMAHTHMLTKKIWLEVNEDQTVLEKINTFNQIFYEVAGFKTVKDQKNRKPNHFYLNFLLETHSGNSYSLGYLYLLLARNLELPVYPVLLDEQVILAVCKRFAPMTRFDTPDENDVVFYVNPGNKGFIFGKNEIDVYLDKLGLEREPKYYRPIRLHHMLVGYLDKLKMVYESEGVDNRVKKLDAIIDIIETRDDWFMTDEEIQALL